MSALLRGPEAVHDAGCASVAAPPYGSAWQHHCNCGAFLQQRILDDFWASDLPSVRKVKRLCKLVDLLPGSMK